MDVHATEVMPWVRYEQAMASVDTNNLQSGLDTLFKEHPEFTNIYFYRVINDYYEPDTSAVNIYNIYRHSHIIKSLQDTIALVFSDVSAYEKLYADAFARMKKVLPNVTTPKIYTCLTELSTAAFLVTDDIMGVSLEMYLGSGSTYYDLDTWPRFVQRSMNKDNVIPNLLKNYIRNTQLPAVEPKTMLDHMLAQGKELYVLKHLLPSTMDTLLFDFSDQQLEFCQANEKQIWSFMLDQKLVYDTNYKNIQRYVMPAPTSPGMPEDAPGRAAIYIGFKIVETFMNRYPETTMKNLLENTNSQQILDAARYKP